MDLEKTVLDTGTKDTQVSAVETSNEKSTSTERMFSQTELNEILKSRLDRERKKYPSEEELKLFQDWKSSQQSEQEKYQELISKYDELKKEYTTYKNYNLVKNENVNELFIDFIIDNVSKQEGNFEENLKTFREKNPQFFDTNKLIKMSTSTNLERNKKEEPKRTAFKQYF